MINKMGGDDPPDLEGVDDEVCMSIVFCIAILYFSDCIKIILIPSLICLSSRNPKVTADVDMHWHSNWVVGWLCSSALHEQFFKLKSYCSLTWMTV